MYQLKAAILLQQSSLERKNFVNLQDTIVLLSYQVNYVRHEKLTEVSVSYFFRADDYTVVMETFGMKYGTKKYKGEQQRLRIIWYHRLKFQVQVEIEVNCIFISQFYA